jgi:hypothetical protein
MISNLRYEESRIRNGRVAIKPVSDGSNPLTEWIRVVSRLSSKLIGGRIVGMRFASMVLPAPGGPTRRLLWTLSGYFDDIQPV